MIRAVLDTNTIVSAIIVPAGIPAKILAAARAAHLSISMSPPIVNEVLRALQRDRVRRKYHLTVAEIEGVRLLLEKETTPTRVTREVHGIATHPEDDLILATASAAKADYLVTGDRQLQKLGSYEGTKIVSPREFLAVLEAQEAEGGQP